MTIANINQEIRDICGGDSNTEQLDNTTLLRRVNTAYEEITAKIMGMDGKWQFDDTNYTDFPVGVGNLTASQQDYTFAADVLEVEGISILDSSGNFQKLIPIDDKELGIDPSEFMETDGMPFYYDKQGRSILLYPAPAAANVTLTNGLKVFFKRTADLYTSAQVTTGTKQPGFASPFHLLIVYKACLPFLNKYLPEEVNWVLREIQLLEKGLADHYGRREVDRRKIITMKGINAE